MITVKSNPKNIELFTTRDRRILSLSKEENKQEVFKAVNANKVNIDRTVFHKSSEDKAMIKRMRKSSSNFENKLIKRA